LILKTHIIETRLDSMVFFQTKNINLIYYLKEKNYNLIMLMIHMKQFLLKMKELNE